MKRTAAWLLILLLLLTGCAQKEESPQPKLILRYADNQPEDYPTTKAAEYFAKLVEARTNGEICFRVYSGGVLGDEFSVFEQVQFGGIDMTRVSLGTFSEYYPESQVLQLPYLYDDADHMWRVLDGEIGDTFLEGIETAGVIGLSWFDAGSRSFYTREKITSLEDLKGLQIRVQESDVMQQMVRLLGATPVQLSYGDVYSALQTAEIDGAENNWPSYESTGHFEAAPYVLRDEHSRLPEMQIISTVAMEKITAVDPAYADVIRECAQESAVYERVLWKQTEVSAEKRLQELGCTVTELSPEELERFRTAVQPLYDSCSEEIHLLIAKIRES